MQTIRQINSRSPPQRTANGPVSSSDNTINALDRNPPISEVRNTREANNHGGTNVVRLRKSTLSPDKDLQCAVETSRSNIKVTIVRQTINYTLYTHYPRCLISFMTILLQWSSDGEKEKKYIYLNLHIIKIIHVENKVEVLLLYRKLFTFIRRMLKRYF